MDAGTLPPDYECSATRLSSTASSDAPWPGTALTTMGLEPDSVKKRKYCFRKLQTPPYLSKADGTPKPALWIESIHGQGSSVPDD